MKQILTYSLAVATLAMATTAVHAQPRMLDPDKPADALEIMKRVQCGEADNVPAVYYWEGPVYSRVRGEPDRHLFNGKGMNIRQCITINDPERGTGYRQVSREVMFYLDPKTNEVLRTWTNPWTQEEVEVFHIANDPVNSRPNYPVRADGSAYSLPMRRAGDFILMPITVPLFYPNVLAGDYQEYVGNTYHSMEIFDFTLNAQETLDTSNPTTYPSISWVRISDFMPWMKMRGRQGQIVFNAMGVKLRSYDELPEVVKQEISTNYPEYAAPPPVDDKRPNETTWTVFKRIIDERRAAAVQQD